MSEISEKSESEKIYFEERLIGIADGFMISTSCIINLSLISLIYISPFLDQWTIQFQQTDSKKNSIKFKTLEEAQCFLKNVGDLLLFKDLRRK